MFRISSRGEQQSLVVLEEFVGIDNQKEAASEPRNASPSWMRLESSGLVFLLPF